MKVRGADILFLGPNKNYCGCLVEEGGPREVCREPASVKVEFGIGKPEYFCWSCYERCHPEREGFPSVADLRKEYEEAAKGANI